MTQKGWKELAIGGIIDQPGTAEEYHTGGWRNFKPIRDEQRCTNCLLCWMHCPDTAITAEDGKFKEFDLRYCKGCGICAYICPVKCIEMKKE